MKNIYTVRVIDQSDLPFLLKDMVGRQEYLIVLGKDIQWSAEAIIPDFNTTDQFDLDIIFDDDFRTITEVNIGTRFDIDFSIADKRVGIREVEIIGIRSDNPINHLQNKN